MQKIKIIMAFGIFYMLGAFEVYALQNSLADPDSIATGYEYNGTPAVKVGNYFQISGLNFGGFIEARNESRFDQAVLPNHNWRGFAFMYYAVPLEALKSNAINWTIGIEHESAHATMGFYEHNDRAYEMIYDNYYRNVNLNSTLVRLSHSVGAAYKLDTSVDYQFYFLGKNTPELHNHDLAQSHGLSAGMQMTLALNKSLSVYIAVFDRYIAQSRAERRGYIYHDTDGAVAQRLESYPIINNVNTFTVKCGVLVHEFVALRKLNIYAKILYGNSFGFVDSRDNRFIAAGGIEIVQ